MLLKHHTARSRKPATPGVQPDCVVSERAAAEMLGISPDTLRRTVKRGEGPCRISLSPRRVGYRLTDLHAWLDKRTRGRRSRDRWPRCKRRIRR